MNTEEQEIEQIPHDEGTAEDKASRLGWVPQAEYKGRRQWVDAEEYLAQLEEDSPKLRHINAKLVREVQSLKTTTQELISHHEREVAHTRQEAYDRAAQDIANKHAEAVAAGDVDGAQKALKAQQNLDKQISNPPVAKKTLSPEDQEAVADFKEQHADWFEVDPEMTKFAKDYESALAAKGVSLADRLRMTTEKVQRRFPQEFASMNNDEPDDTPAPRQQPARTPQGRSNTSSIRRPAPKPAVGSYEALNNTGKAACDKFCSAHADKAKAKATWLKYARNDASLFN